MSSPSPVARIEEWLIAGEHQQATQTCLDLLAEHPADVDLLVMLALCEEASGNQSDAIERLETLHASHPEHVRALFHLGRLHLAKGNLLPARNALESSIALAPNHAPSRHLLGRLDEQQGEKTKAIENMRVALIADADYIPALCDLAVLLVEQGQIDEAHRHAAHAVRLEANEAGVQLAMGLVLEAQQHLDFAEQCLVNATNQDPNTHQGLMALARVYQQQSRHAEALETLQRLSDEQKQHQAARYARAFSLIRMGQTKPAKELLEGLVAQAPDAKTVLELMDLYIQLNDAPSLVALAENLDRAAPSVAWAGAFLDARLAEFSGRLEEAIETLQNLTETDKVEQLIRVHLLLARLYLKNNDPESSIHALEQLAEQPNLHHRVRWEIAQLAEQAGNPTLSLRMIDAVLANASSPAQVLGRSRTMRLHLLDRLERFDEAAAMLQDATSPMGWLPVPKPLMDTEVPNFDWSKWQPVPESQDAPGLIWVLGWPWAGRELVLAALAQIEGARVLPLAEGITRHQHLGMVPGEAYHVALLPDQIAPMRKRYLRGAPDDATMLIEPFPCKASDLIRMHQVFPNAKAVRVTCDPNYLRLQWHLAGYQQVDPMFEAWHQEQEALDALVQAGNIPIVEIALGDLLDSSGVEKAIDQLMASLGQQPNPKMPQHVRALAQRHSYRGPTHWTHYF